MSYGGARGLLKEQEEEPLERAHGMAGEQVGDGTEQRRREGAVRACEQRGARARHGGEEGPEPDGPPVSGKEGAGSGLDWVGPDRVNVARSEPSWARTR